MSINRSVAAAQRRRAAPTPDTRIQAPPAPATSIASAGNFHQQPMPGHLAGQYADVQQKQYLSQQGYQCFSQQQQQQRQQQQQQQINMPQQKGKMTIPQAITLITLRLGRVETHLQDLEFNNLGTENENLNETGEPVINNNIDVAQIMKRLDNIEGSLSEFPAMKEQLSVYKPGIVAIKNTSTANSKDIINMKNDINEMKGNINELLTFMKSCNEELSQLKSQFNDQWNKPMTTEINSLENADIVEEQTKVNESLENLEPSDIKEMVKNALKMEISEVPTASVLEEKQENQPPTFSDVNSS